MGRLGWSIPQRGFGIEELLGSAGVNPGAGVYILGINRHRGGSQVCSTFRSAGEGEGKGGKYYISSFYIHGIITSLYIYEDDPLWKYPVFLDPN